MNAQDAFILTAEELAFSLDTDSRRVISAYATEISAAVLLAVIYCSEAQGIDDYALNSVAFITLTFAQLFHVFNMPSNRYELFIKEIIRNGFVWLAVFFAQVCWQVCLCFRLPDWCLD